MEKNTAPGEKKNLKKAMLSDLTVISALILIFVMMIVPIPPFLLDVLYTINIAFCLVIVISSMYLLEPLSFSIFPSMLLIMTLFRLALNLSGSRAILLHGYAGDVIEAFGQFVVGGNYVVGIIIFLILVITVSPRVESLILQAVSDSPQAETFGALSPDLLRRLYTNPTKCVEKVTSMGHQAIVICSGPVRLPFKRLTERVLKKLVVLSFNEIEFDYTIEAAEEKFLDEITMMRSNARS